MKLAAATLSILTIVGSQLATHEVETPAPPPPAPPVPQLGIKAMISGVEGGKIYQELPPALVELSHLPAGAAVWVKVCGPNIDEERSAAVGARFMPNPNGEALLPLPGLSRLCDSDGEWTVRVLANCPGGEVRLLAKSTFHLRHAVEESDEARALSPQ